MRVFLTGGTGFIGSYVLKKLLEEGHEVVAHRRNEFSKPKIKISNDINWLTKSIREILPEDFCGIDILVHLASHSVQYPYDVLANNILYNVIEPLELLGKAVEGGVRNFVIAGSCFEYGTAGERYDFIPADAPLEPTNDYATSKAMSFLAFKQFALNHKINLSYQRIFQAFGEGQPETRLWPSLKTASIQNRSVDLTLGEQVRDFVPVEEVAESLIKASLKIIGFENQGIIVENIGSGRAQSIRQFVEYWWNMWGSKGQLKFGTIPYRDNEVMRFVPKI
jgi:nucleoside-diphosphate-sugar epimerase